jgi:hypothetical protein
MPRLPTELPEWVQVHPRYPNIESTYGICLRLENKLQEENDLAKDTTKDIIYCRILGYLFHHAPTPAAIKTLIYEVVSAKDDEALLKVGEMYFNHYIRARTSSERFSGQILTGIPSQVQ